MKKIKTGKNVRVVCEEHPDICCDSVQDRTSGFGFHICSWVTSAVCAALWSQWKTESEIQTICWHTDAEWLRYSCFYIPVYPVVSSGLEIRTCHFHPPKKQMTVNMCETFKVTESFNFDLFELYFLLYQMDPSLSSSPSGLLLSLYNSRSKRVLLDFYFYCYSLCEIALHSFDYLCGKQLYSNKEDI